MPIMKNSLHNSSRRLFLRQSAAMSTLGVAAPFAMNLAAMGSVAAQTADDYKALVCVFLMGGNDAYNTVLATDADSWKAYAAVRNQAPSSLVIDRSKLLDLTPSQPLSGGRSLALHPSLKGMQGLFNQQRRLAIVSNVGALVEPLTKSQYLQASKRIPSKLFSHNDQQSTWQALAPEGAALGWGGRLADAVASGNGNSLFTGISAAGNAVWLTGEKVRQYQMVSSGAARIGVVTNEYNVDHIYGSPQVAEAMARIVSTTRTSNKFEADLVAVAQRSQQAQSALGNSMPSADLSPYGPSSQLMYMPASGVATLNPLAQQLQVVARAIGAHSALGMKRQVFFVCLNGFDTHDDQTLRHADLLARLDHGITYFDNVMGALGMRDRVTTFTASDFGRTFTSNGDGSDHGWGAHHFVLGGAVNGGMVVGDLPIYAMKNSANNNFDGSADQLVNGVLLPRQSIEQYGGALGKWFGASSALSTVFPNLGNFSGLMPLMA